MFTKTETTFKTRAVAVDLVEAFCRERGYTRTTVRNVNGRSAIFFRNRDIADEFEEWYTHQSGIGLTSVERAGRLKQYAKRSALGLIQFDVVDPTVDDKIAENAMMLFLALQGDDISIGGPAMTAVRNNCW